MARGFNGSEFIVVGVKSIFSPTIVSVSCWFYPTSLANAYSAVVSKNGTGTSIFQLFVKSNGTLAVYVHANANVTQDGAGVATLSTNTWYHLAFTYSSANGLKVYINGSLDSTAAANGVLSGTDSELDFGKDAVSAGRVISGRLADVGIWNVELTAGEISGLNRGQRAPTVRPASILGYWPLDGLASPEPDFSGNKDNGTLTGTSLVAGPPIAPFTSRWPQRNIPDSSSFTNPVITSQVYRPSRTSVVAY